ncbi:MAG: glucosidase [Verrucomicrobia bacterium]|nr:glucosidase [Verrucomicrobiota bacterium]
MTPEHQRLHEPSKEHVVPWKKWGPYVAERAWGTVREDYSAEGEAWDYFPHDLARSKAYRWGEDGLAAICDRYQILVFAVALWNGRDPILKERLFGLVPTEGNHGEDVKEYYFYLDSTPTHSYLKYLYKYPQTEFPYSKLIEENRKRLSNEPEYELLDTGIFDDNRYFDIFVEYAKAAPEDICIRIEVFNRGPEPAPIHVLPHLWFRNRWAWGKEARPEPRISLGRKSQSHLVLIADDTCCHSLKKIPYDYRLGRRHLYADPGAQPLFTNNETNCERVFDPAARSRSPFVKDAFHRHIIEGADCVNPEQFGTKACLHYVGQIVPAGGSVVFRLRLTDESLSKPLAEIDKIIATRRAEADEFYATIHPASATEDERRIQRQALAGLLWSKQIYLFDVAEWLDGDFPDWPPPESRKSIRNVHWRHLNSKRILSMPDKWEYPWFAAWDLAFQAVPLTLVDPEFAKQQLWLLLFEQFQHPNGQLPAYEWEFSDMNPPVHAWAIWRVYNMDRIRSGKADRAFLEKCFHKLLINFTWWVNKVDSDGNNVFEGGFLGLDNITVVDRSKKMPDGAVLQQSDGSGWMGMFWLNMMRIALELAKENKAYEGLATKFFEHYVYIGAAMKNMGRRGYELWDEQDGFFYDVLSYADGSFQKFRVRSLVGLIPMFAVERLEEDWLEPFPEFRANMHWFLKNRQDLVEKCVTTLEHDGKKVHVLAIMNPEQMQRLLRVIWSPKEFRSDFGLRSLSKYHEAHPYQFDSNEIRYEPAESVARLKGGNSNWRGPIWFPTTFMMIESLRKLRKAYGGAFAIGGCASVEDCVNLEEMADGFANNLIRLFTRNERNKRPIYGAAQKFQSDPHWRDYILFHEYFHGDTGQGLGASHQTGWTALVASLIDEWRK